MLPVSPIRLIGFLGVLIIFSELSGTLTGSWIGYREARTQTHALIQDAGLESSGFTCCTEIPTSILPFKCINTK